MADYLTLNELCVSFGDAPALRGIDLTINRGESVGFVGESGSGKSVTWLATLGLLPQKARISGQVILEGRDLLTLRQRELDRVRGAKIAMIFQDPSSALNPMLTIRRQIAEAIALHRGLSGKAIKAEARRLLDMVGIPDAENRLNAYPHEFSGGQNQRIMIAMALASEPDMLIADEPTTALDVTIQAQILRLLASVQKETGMALVLISHDLGIVAQTCDRVAVMYAGRIVEEAKASTIFDNPAHPYSRGLIDSLPSIDGARQRLHAIPGQIPDPRDISLGCAFSTRCSYAHSKCHTELPRLAGIASDRNTACHLGADLLRSSTGPRAASMEDLHA